MEPSGRGQVGGIKWVGSHGRNKDSRASGRGTYVTEPNEILAAGLDRQSFLCLVNMGCYSGSDSYHGLVLQQADLHIQWMGLCCIGLGAGEEEGEGACTSSVASGEPMNTS